MGKKKIIKVIATVVVVALLVLPLLSSIRRALMLHGKQGFENDTFWQLLFNQLQTRYLSVFTDYTTR